MPTFLAEVREMVVPSRGSQHGPLPPLLVALTFVTGLVDAFSYLVLGHVFVANMTGNVIILGFALVGTPGFSIGASVVALATFGIGALVGGRIGTIFAEHRGRQLTTATALQSALVAASVVLALLSGSPVSPGYRYGLITVLAVAMGIQNATARRLAIPDLTTTVLTLTITGIAADSAIAGGTGSKSGRRLVAVAATLAGAVIGAAGVLHLHIALAPALALGVLVIVGVTTHVLGRSQPPWAMGS